RLNPSYHISVLQSIPLVKGQHWFGRMLFAACPAYWTVNPFPKSVLCVIMQRINVQEEKNGMEELLGKYQAWLGKRLTPKDVSSQLSRIKRIAKHYDILNEYALDRCASLLDMLNYTAYDRKQGNEPQADIVIQGDYYTGFASLKRALKYFVHFLDSIHYKAPPKKTHPSFCGDFDDFKRFVGPKCRNEVNIFCKSERQSHHKICEYCGKEAELQSAHIVDRPIIMHDILEKEYKRGEDYYEVDLLDFLEHFKQAHMPIKDHIFFLCKACHDALDKSGKLTVDDIKAKRGY
ncbi:MAG: hypothetical protein J5755_02835, partial [Clostridia bacterium]|nr:hypothetical protein [Clostridia bacterium]